MSDLIERLEARADIEEHGAAISSDEPISALLREAIAALRAQLGVAEDELASLRAQIAQPADMEKAVAAADATEWDGDVFIGSTMTAKITAALPFLRWAASDRELLIRVRDWMSDNIRERDIEGASILGEVASLIATLKPVGNADATGEGKVAVDRETIARAIAQADEQNGGPPFDLRVQEKHARNMLFDEADAVLAVLASPPSRNDIIEECERSLEKLKRAEGSALGLSSLLRAIDALRALKDGGRTNG